MFDCCADLDKWHTYCSSDSSLLTPTARGQEILKVTLFAMNGPQSEPSLLTRDAGCEVPLATNKTAFVLLTDHKTACALLTDVKTACVLLTDHKTACVLLTDDKTACVLVTDHKTACVLVNDHKRSWM